MAEQPTNLHEVVHQLTVDLRLMQKDLENLSDFYKKIETVMSRLEVSVSRQESVMISQERTLESIEKFLKGIELTNEKKEKDFQERLTSLERFRWIITGGTIVVVFLSDFFSEALKKLLT